MITQLSLLSTQPPRRTFRSWLRSVTRYFDHGTDALAANRVVTLRPLSTCRDDRAELRLSAYAGEAEPARGDVLLFPIRGEALLARLAETLRSRLAKQRLDHGLLLLTVRRPPGSRLLIDGMAHVDFLRDRAAYRVAVEAIPDTRVIVETSDFDTLVRFVVQYLNDRLSEPAAAEASL